MGSMELLPTFRSLTDFMTDERTGEQPPVVVWSACALAVQDRPVEAGVTQAEFSEDGTSWRIVVLADDLLVETTVVKADDSWWVLSNVHPGAADPAKVTLRVVVHHLDQITSWSIEGVRELSTENREAVGDYTFAFSDGHQLQLDVTSSRNREQREAFEHLIKALVR